jgi:hypothetical protein
LTDALRCAVSCAHHSSASTATDFTVDLRERDFPYTVGNAEIETFLTDQYLVAIAQKRDAERRIAVYEKAELGVGPHGDSYLSAIALAEREDDGQGCRGTAFIDDKSSILCG